MLMQARGVGDGTGWLRVAEHQAAPWLPPCPAPVSPGMGEQGWLCSSPKERAQRGISTSPALPRALGSISCPVLLG